MLNLPEQSVRYQVQSDEELRGRFPNAVYDPWHVRADSGEAGVFFWELKILEDGKPPYIIQVNH